MIDWSQHSLKEVLRYEKAFYVSSNKELVCRSLMFAERVQIWKFQKALRKAEYYGGDSARGFVAKIKYVLNLRKKNKLGNKLGLSIHCGCFDIGLHICHFNVVVNGDAFIGKNCTLHGNNCIGNNHNSNDEVPIIGDNVEFGWGASCFGKIEIVSNVMLGAHTLVVKDICEQNTVWVGNPQHKIKEFTS